MGRPLYFAVVISLMFVVAASTPVLPQDKAPVEPVPSETIGINAPSTVENKSERQKQIEEKIRSQINEVKASSQAPAEEEEPDHIRGEIVDVKGSLILVKESGRDRVLSIELPQEVTILSLSKDSYTSVDFGVYVGAVGVKMDQYSPIVRDSLSWLHEGFELRFVDDELRGIALGHRKWDLTPETIMAHGWVDDIEDRVISIKYGPSELEETDVEIGRGKPVFRMSLGEKSLIKAGVHVFAGARNGGNGKHTAVFIIIGKDGLVPAL